MYKVTYIDLENNSLEKIKLFETIQKAIAFTNENPRERRTIQLIYCDDKTVKENNKQ